MEPDRLSRELADKLEAARITAEAVSLDAQLARDTVGRWIRGTTVPTLASLRAVEDVLGARLGYAVDLSAAIRERRSARQRERLRADGAQGGEIAVYLEALIAWLNADPWTHWFGQPALAPAAMERKLLIADGHGWQVRDADELARRCVRLVVLGGPGSGKTWLARRTARLSAEAALQRLDAGDSLDTVELPLYTTCARIAAAPVTDAIRRVVVSSALGQLPDLGGSRILDAMQALFEERDAPTLLIADSLDEARGADDRIGLADTLPGSWRIMLTTRPAAWHDQLAIRKDDPSQLAGVLQPLRYPDDVEPFIAAWFAEQTEWGDELAAAIARRPGLQRAVTVPLILAFYCILGSSSRLPDTRSELYAKVLRRMLTGRWRGSHDDQADVRACLRVLRAWAGSGATSHPVSGVGTWADDIDADPSGLGQAGDRVLDHVATPLGPPDLDSGKSLRRFIHRSIQEHLVAEHVAGLPVDLAAEALLPHLWYDPDWEYAAPAAIAMHPQHEQLLRTLTCRAARVSRLPADLSAINAGQEWHRLLARVAAESREADWPPDLAGTLGRARAELAVSGVGDLGGAASWETWNIQLRDALLDLLAHQTSEPTTARLVSWLAQLTPAEEDKRQVSKELLALLNNQTKGSVARQLVAGVIRLSQTGEGRRHTRNMLLAMLAGQTLDFEVGVKMVGRKAFSRLVGWDIGPSLDDIDHGVTEQLVAGVVQLAPAAEEKRKARKALLKLLRGPVSERDPFPGGGMRSEQLAKRFVSGVVQLAPAAEDKREAREALIALLGPATLPHIIEYLLDGVVQLAPEAEDKREARERLLALLIIHSGEAGKNSSSDSHSFALRLADGLGRLDPTTEDKRQAFKALLALLATLAPSTGQTLNPLIAGYLVTGVVQLTETAADKHEAREALLALLHYQVNVGAATKIAGAVAQLDPTAEDRRQSREMLLTLLAREAQIADGLPEVLVRLAPEAADKRQALEVLLALLPRVTSSVDFGRLVTGVTQLASAIQDMRQSREALLTLLACQADAVLAGHLVTGVVQLHPTLEDRQKARGVMLTHLASKTRTARFEYLMGCLVKLAPDAEDKRQAREALLTLMASQTGRVNTAVELAGGVVQLDPTPEDKRQARETLLVLLSAQASNQAADETSLNAAGRLLGLVSGVAEPPNPTSHWGWVAQLDPTTQDKRRSRETLITLLTGHGHTVHPLIAEEWVRHVVRLSQADDKRQVREALLALLPRQSDGRIAACLAEAMIQLEPTAHDRGQVGRMLFTLLARETSTWYASMLVSAVVHHALSTQDKQQAREALLTLLAAQQTHPAIAGYLVEGIVQLKPQTQDKRQTRVALLALLARQADKSIAAKLINAMTRINPTASDLGSWRTWAVPPTREMLAAVRSNSSTDEWLALLPSLAPLAEAPSSNTRRPRRRWSV